MAARVQELCRPSWRRVRRRRRRASGRRQRTRTTSAGGSALPGFGEMKITALGSVLAKRYGVQAGRRSSSRPTPHSATWTRPRRSTATRRRSAPTRPSSGPSRAEAPPSRHRLRNARAPVDGRRRVARVRRAGRAGVHGDLSRRRDRGGRVRRRDGRAGSSEETGLTVEVLRVLGEVENPDREPDYFVQAAPTERLPDSWEHEIPGQDGEPGYVVVCRWAPVDPDAEFWGLRGAFVHTLVRERVVAYVTRQGPSGLDLLTIEQGDIKGGVQVPGRPARSVRARSTVSLAKSRRRRGLQGSASCGAWPTPTSSNGSTGLAPTAAIRSCRGRRRRPGGMGAPVPRFGRRPGLVYLCRWVRFDECPPLGGMPIPRSTSSGGR